MAMRMSGQPTTPSEAISVGEIVGTMPFAYLRTAVLMSNLKGRGMFSGGYVETSLGAPGFYVGKYRTSSNFAALEWGFWCFLPKRVGGSAESVCLLRPITRETDPVIIKRNSNPFWPDEAANFPKGNVAEPVVIVERPVEITSTPVLQYRFLGWTAKGAQVQFLVSQRPAGNFDAKLENDGAVHLGMLNGSYIALTHDSKNPALARARFVQSASGAR
jgi:hypothetical protein